MNRPRLYVFKWKVTWNFKDILFKTITCFINIRMFQEVLKELALKSTGVWKSLELRRNLQTSVSNLCFTSHFFLLTFLLLEKKHCGILQGIPQITKRIRWWFFFLILENFSKVHSLGKFPKSLKYWNLENLGNSSKT